METVNNDGKEPGQIETTNQPAMMPNQPAMMPGQIPGQIPGQTEQNPELQKLNELMKKLISANTNLVIRVATCKCKNRENCKVYREAQNIAEIIEELQEVKT